MVGRVGIENDTRLGHGLERALDDINNDAISASKRNGQDDRLDSWKKIASYLKRDVSTVQRWERREAMPIHRHLHDKQGSVFAFRSELDAWWVSRHVRLTEGAEAEQSATPTIEHRTHPPRLLQWGIATAIILMTGALAWYASKADYFWRNPLVNAKFIRLLDFAGTEQAASISRDGQFVAFLSDHDGQIDAWVSEVSSGTYRNLTHG